MNYFFHAVGFGLLMLDMCTMYAMQELQTSLAGLQQSITPLMNYLQIISPEYRPVFIQGPWLFQNTAANIFQKTVLSQDKKAIAQQIIRRVIDRAERGKYVSQLSDFEYVNCGYHALFNGIALVNALNTNDSVRATYMSQLIDAKKYITDFVIFKDTIINYRVNLGQQSDNGTWLQGNELELLIDAAWNKRMFVNTLTHPSITVIDNIDWFSISGAHIARGLINDIINVIERYRKSVSFAHVFLLGSATEYQDVRGFIQGTWGHWIALGVNKVSGQTQYIVLDSLNHNRTTSPLVLRMKEVLEREDIIGMQIRVSGISNTMDTVRVMMEVLYGDNPEYRGTMQDAVTAIITAIISILDQATKGGYIRTPAFAIYKQELLSVVQDIILTRSVSLETNTVQLLYDLQERLERNR